MRAALTAMPLLLLAACSGGGDDPATSAEGWEIAPGTYGNVVMADSSDSYQGVELRLPEGSESETVEMVRCDGWCGQVERQPVRRGLNGLSFAFHIGERTVDVALTPHGPDRIELTADWGEGVTSQPLLLLEQPVGLAAAHGKPPAE